MAALQCLCSQPQVLAWASHGHFCDCAGKAKQKLKGFGGDAGAVLHRVGFGVTVCNGWILGLLNYGDFWVPVWQVLFWSQGRFITESWNGLG